MSKRLSLSGFSFTRLVIIQSLDEIELKTGSSLHQFTSGLIASSGLNLPIDLVNVNNADQFLAFLSELETTAKSRSDIPIVHVECHGSKHGGLEFSDESSLDWKAVSNALLKINLATKFNLLAIFSACFGAYFISQMGATKHCPCWCIVAPTEEIRDYEILQALMLFYRVFFDTNDLGLAVSKISNIPTDHGQWFGKTAELWFEEQVEAYIRNHCTNEAALTRRQLIYKALKNDGQRRSKGRIARDFKAMHKQSFTGEYFDTFFMTKLIPDNKARFGAAKKRLEDKIGQYKRNKGYDL